MLSPYYYQIIIIIGINIILALGLNLVTGFTGQLSLGHAAFMAIGAYTSGILTSVYKFPFLPALAAGGFVAAIFGLILGLPTLKLKGDYLAIVTLGFGEIVRISIQNLKITGGPFGLRNIPKETNLLLILFCVGLCYFTIIRLLNSRVGRALIAIREDEIAAEAMGIDTTHYKVCAFVISAFWAGISGGLFAHWFRYLNSASFGFMRSIEILCMVVLGGIGSMGGAVLGAVVLTSAPELLRNVSSFVSEYRMLFYGALLVIMMLVRPQGLIGGGLRLFGTRLKKEEETANLAKEKLNTRGMEGGDYDSA